MFNPDEIAKGPKMAKKTTAAKTEKGASPPGVGHNNTGLEDSQERVFIREFGNIKTLNTDMAGTKGELGGSFKRLESAGFTKDQISWALKLEKMNVSEVIRDMRMKISIAKLLGHGVGRQLDILDDRTPLEDQAYIEGMAVGKFGGEPANPYGMETTPGQAWLKGMQDGNVIRNAALNEAINGGEQADIIRGPGDQEDAGDDEKTEDGPIIEGEVVKTDSDDDWDNADPARSTEE